MPTIEELKAQLRDLEQQREKDFREKRAELLNKREWEFHVTNVINPNGDNICFMSVPRASIDAIINNGIVRIDKVCMNREEMLEAGLHQDDVSSKGMRYGCLNGVILSLGGGTYVIPMYSLVSEQEWQLIVNEGIIPERFIA